LYRPPEKPDAKGSRSPNRNNNDRSYSDTMCPPLRQNNKDPCFMENVAESKKCSSFFDKMKKLIYKVA